MPLPEPVVVPRLRVLSDRSRASSCRSSRGSRSVLLSGSFCASQALWHKISG